MNLFQESSLQNIITSAIVLMNSTKVYNSLYTESVIQQKEFYARPQKLRHTIWPPYEDGMPSTLSTHGETPLNRNGAIKIMSGTNAAGQQPSVVSPVSAKMRDLGVVDSQNASTADIEENDKM